MIEKAVYKKFERAIPLLIDTGGALQCIVDNILNYEGEYAGELDQFMNWVKKQGYQKNEIIGIFKVLDKHRIIAIDPYSNYIEVKEYKPNAYKKIRRAQRWYRIEQKYGKRSLFSKKVNTGNLDVVYKVKDKFLNKEYEFSEKELWSFLKLRLHPVEMKSYRLGRPPQPERFHIKKSYREESMETVTYEYVKSDGKKISEGKLYRKLEYLYIKYFSV
jgi:hypothetical protein